MFTPVGQRWSLAMVRWWGRWADGEQRNTLICYLLDELHTYETDYSDALAPFSREAESSLVGEQALMRPASTKELRMVHASVTADVNHLRVNINDSLRSLTSMVQATSSCLQAARHVPHLTTPSTDATHMPTAQLEEDPHFTLVSTSSAQAPCISTPWYVHPPATHTPPLSSIHGSQGHTHITPTARTLPSVAVFA
ncbi:hypothetical protein EV702DRAFT_977982 [Suillus placidus]|uniref:Uncharacterized protein n=1 Tax=Suillus placidus TaxID=48579 RepID=A0A9P6ZKV5_9AGAM|nr:hypothetical protein EV702DRAFT_977982 [Suillus placidus]